MCKKNIPFITYQESIIGLFLAEESENPISIKKGRDNKKFKSTFSSSKNTPIKAHQYWIFLKHIFYSILHNDNRY
jgi:hypothetical protein